MDSPRGLRNDDVIAARREMYATAENVQPLREWTDALVERRSRKGTATIVPWFDPAEAGVAARVLVLLEAPGPMTNADNARPGSGFISVDNDDQTAENSWRLRDAVGLSEHTLHWNIVPWYLGPASTKPNALEVEQGAAETRRLLALLPDLRVVLACGRYAQKGWQRHIAPFTDSGLTVIDTWHPSPLSMKQPGKRENLQRAFERAAMLTNY